MAVYITGRKDVVDPSDNCIKAIMEYSADYTTDIADLPGKDEIKEGSVAFVMETSDVYMLGENGWKIL